MAEVGAGAHGRLADGGARAAEPTSASAGPTVGGGVAQIQALLATGAAQPDAIAALILAHPAEAGAMMGAVHAGAGNMVAFAVLRQVQDQQRATEPAAEAAALPPAIEGSTGPYVDRYGSGTAGPAFQVEAGQLTFDAEGREGGKFHTRVAHVPPGPSGVTIGRGYDLGQHSAAQIITAMTAAGLSTETARAYAAAAGLRGAKAKAWLAAHHASLPEITPTQQEALFTITYQEMARDVDRISGKPGVVEAYGRADLDEINPAITDTLIDLRYRGDYTGSARERVQGAAARDDLLRLTDAMADRAAWKHVPEDRFQRRLAYLRQVELETEGEAYGYGGGPMAEHMPSLTELQREARAGRTPPGGAGGPADVAPAAAEHAGASPTSTSTQAKASAAKGTARDDDWTDGTLVEYADWVRLELARLRDLDGEARRARSQELLREIERFVGALRRPGETDAFELARQPLAEDATGAWVPPELIGATRELALYAEHLDGGEDWHSRLGASQYRTQSDNLAAPEATCNVTSMAMVLERLGYSRADLLAAIDREVKRRWLRAQGQATDGVDLSDVALPKGQFGAEVLRYLDHEQAAGKGYQRLRGHDTSRAERKEMAAAFSANAQLEDLVDFLLSMLGIDRTSITPAATKLLGKIETDAADRPTVQTLRNDGKVSWATVRAEVHAALEAGGSAILSVFHKGAGKSGTHLVVPQQVVSGGMIIDDPYGRIRAGYDRRKAGDAYADPGKSRAGSKHRNVPTHTDHDGDGRDDDWMVEAASELTAAEARGDSNEHSDAMLARAWNYVTLYRRGAASA
ncbi:MAG: hypothetical protein KBG28_16320 [Kofleriaceae bacterium]|nr:hypothetical protein [Kofleriaceae bacterium]